MPVHFFKSRELSQYKEATASINRFPEGIKKFIEDRVNDKKSNLLKYLEESKPGLWNEHKDIAEAVINELGRNQVESIKISVDLKSAEERLKKLKSKTRIRFIPFKFLLRNRTNIIKIEVRKLEVEYVRRTGELINDQANKWDREEVANKIEKEVKGKLLKRKYNANKVVKKLVELAEVNESARAPSIRPQKRPLAVRLEPEMLEAAKVANPTSDANIKSASTQASDAVKPDGNPIQQPVEKPVPTPAKPASAPKLDAPRQPHAIDIPPPPTPMATGNSAALPQVTEVNLTKPANRTGNIGNISGTNGNHQTPGPASERPVGPALDERTQPANRPPSNVQGLIAKFNKLDKEAREAAEQQFRKP